ncbi:LOW QUALITY PROTEIN: hypothetical protein BCV70DRAFT_221462 [Testicularia cyperi]|uniref:N-acetyltransferase domain-containing protein n=1 Tax=Testicularia cyperi TaxID=1882483 RepID=A0A317XHW8_9BASI|nr:LOW QUALITY PROTEIN: hypothetical protein BCV70DRAFT_221462 [Testicularia cyperi]
MKVSASPTGDDRQETRASPSTTSSHGASASPPTVFVRDGSVPKSSHKAAKTQHHIARILTLTEAVWARIYRDGVATGNAGLTVESIPSWKDFDALMLKRHRFIAADPKDNRTLGWVSCFRPFPSLSLLCQDAEQELDGTRGGDVLELVLFVAAEERGKGVGNILLKTIIESIETDIRCSTVQASFFPENTPAKALFASNGFHPVATRTAIGRMQDGPTKGQWRDLIIMEKKIPDWTQSDHQCATTALDQTSTHALEPAETMFANLMDSTVDPNHLFKRPRHH